MEKPLGVQLSLVWSGMTVEDRLTVVKAIARFQKSWGACLFHRFGSLYYTADLDMDEHTENPLYSDCDGNEVESFKFAVGPSTGRFISDDDRMRIEFDRGPCKRNVWLEPTLDKLMVWIGKILEEYALALDRREIAWVQSLSHLPISPAILFGPGTYQPTRQKKLKALGWYLKICRYLLPTDESI